MPKYRHNSNRNNSYDLKLDRQRRTRVQDHQSLVTVAGERSDVRSSKKTRSQRRFYERMCSQMAASHAITDSTTASQADAFDILLRGLPKRLPLRLAIKMLAVGCGVQLIASAVVSAAAQPINPNEFSIDLAPRPQAHNNTTVAQAVVTSTHKPKESMRQQEKAISKRKYKLPKSNNFKTERIQTALKQEDISKLSALINNGLDVNYKFSDGASLLESAGNMLKHKTCLYLILKGANIKSFTKYYNKFPEYIDGFNTILDALSMLMVGEEPIPEPKLIKTKQTSSRLNIKYFMSLIYSSKHLEMQKSIIDNLISTVSRIPEELHVPRLQKLPVYAYVERINVWYIGLIQNAADERNMPGFSTIKDDVLNGRRKLDDLLALDRIVFELRLNHLKDNVAIENAIDKLQSLQIRIFENRPYHNVMRLLMLQSYYDDVKDSYNSRLSLDSSSIFHKTIKGYTVKLLELLREQYNLHSTIFKNDPKYFFNALMEEIIRSDNAYINHEPVDHYDYIMIYIAIESVLFAVLNGILNKSIDLSKLLLLNYQMDSTEPHKLPWFSLALEFLYIQACSFADGTAKFAALSFLCKIVKIPLDEPVNYLYSAVYKLLDNIIEGNLPESGKEVFAHMIGAFPLAIIYISMFSTVKQILMDKIVNKMNKGVLHREIYPHIECVVDANFKLQSLRYVANGNYIYLEKITNTGTAPINISYSAGSLHGLVSKYLKANMLAAENKLSKKIERCVEKLNANAKEIRLLREHNCADKAVTNQLGKFLSSNNVYKKQLNFCKRSLEGARSKLADKLDDMNGKTTNKFTFTELDAGLTNCIADFEKNIAAISTATLDDNSALAKSKLELISSELKTIRAELENLASLRAMKQELKRLESNVDELLSADGRFTKLEVICERIKDVVKKHAIQNTLGEYKTKASTLLSSIKSFASSEHLSPNTFQEYESEYNSIVDNLNYVQERINASELLSEASNNSRAATNVDKYNQERHIHPDFVDAVEHVNFVVDDDDDSDNATNSEQDSDQDDDDINENNAGAPTLPTHENVTQEQTNVIELIPYDPDSRYLQPRDNLPGQDADLEKARSEAYNAAHTNSTQISGYAEKLLETIDSGAVTNSSSTMFAKVNNQLTQQAYLMAISYKMIRMVEIVKAKTQHLSKMQDSNIQLDKLTWIRNAFRHNLATFIENSYITDDLKKLINSLKAMPAIIGFIFNKPQFSHIGRPALDNLENNIRSFSKKVGNAALDEKSTSQISLNTIKNFSEQLSQYVNSGTQGELREVYDKAKIYCLARIGQLVSEVVASTGDKIRLSDDMINLTKRMAYSGLKKLHQEQKSTEDKFYLSAIAMLKPDNDKLVKFMGTCQAHDILRLYMEIGQAVGHANTDAANANIADQKQIADSMEHLHTVSNNLHLICAKSFIDTLDGWSEQTSKQVHAQASANVMQAAL